MSGRHSIQTVDARALFYIRHSMRRHAITRVRIDQGIV